MALPQLGLMDEGAEIQLLLAVWRAEHASKVNKVINRYLFFISFLISSSMKAVVKSI